MLVWPKQSECDKFYGNPRGKNGHYSTTWAANNLVHVHCPWALYDADTKKPVPFIDIHKKCAASLTNVLNKIWKAVGEKQEEIEKLKYHIFSGSFNYRPKRGASSLSMHAYGCALDFDDKDNEFHSKKHLFKSDALIVKEFEAEGWIWGGRWSSPDAMHFQAARVR